MNLTKRGIDRRRCRTPPVFPLRTADGELVERDRRINAERRQNGFISCQSFFSDVAYGALEPLMELCEQWDLQPGSTLLEPGQENHHLFLLLQGALSVHIDKADAEGGFLILPGECVGEISIIDGQLTTAYVLARDPSRILAIPEQVLWNDFFKNPTIARNFMELVSRRFRARNQVMQEALEQKLRLEHLQRELSIAHDIQANMLPRDDPLWSRHPQLDIQASMTPASEVGGDFYDSFPLDDQRVCLAIGDVSGKGIPAALFMVRTMTLLREAMLRSDDLTAAVGDVNDKLCRDNDRCMFTTLFVGVVDIDNGRFRFVNAGHNRPLFGDGQGHFEFLDAPPGVLVGINERARYQMGERRLAPGETVVMYTDGVTEAADRNGDLYSDQRFRELLNATDVSSAPQAVDVIQRDVRDFVQGAPPSDDLTLLVLRYRGG